MRKRPFLKNKSILVNSEDKKNWLFFGGMFLLVVLSVGATYYRYIVARDYFVTFEAPCDPEGESCFLYECDPSVEGAECSENPEDNTYYYKNIQKKAYALQSCVGNLGDCLEATCVEGERDCMEMQCGSVNAGPDGKCYGPGLIEEDMTDSNEASMDDGTAIGHSEGVSEDGAMVGDEVTNEEGEDIVDDDGDTLDEDMDMREGVIDGSGDADTPTQDNQGSIQNDGHTLQ